MSKFENLLRFIKLSWKVFNAGYEKGSYHRYVKKYVLPVLRDKMELAKPVIPDQSFRKMQWYMVSGLFLGELLARLKGRALTDTDRRVLALCGGLISMADIATDDFKLDGNILAGLLENPGETGSSGNLGKMLLFIYHETMECIPPDNRERFKAELIQGMKAQISSSRQFHEDITENEVSEITLAKGSSSVMLCYRVLFSDDELPQHAIRQLGGFIQFLNDSQDLPRDIREGVMTFIRFKKDFNGIEQELTFRKMELFDTFKTLNFPKDRIEDFLFVFECFYWGIIYKLRYYKKICQNKPDPEKIISIPKSKFRVSPVSPRFFWFCLPKAMRFRV